VPTLGARLLYVVAVAAIAFVWQCIYFKPHGLIVALFVCSWVVPVINALYRHDRFTWEIPRGPSVVGSHGSRSLGGASEEGCLNPGPPAFASADAIRHTLSWVGNRAPEA